MSRPGQKQLEGCANCLHASAPEDSAAVLAPPNGEKLTAGGALGQTNTSGLAFHCSGDRRNSLGESSCKDFDAPELGGREAALQELLQTHVALGSAWRLPSR